MATLQPFRKIVPYDILGGFCVVPNPLECIPTSFWYCSSPFRDSPERKCMENILDISPKSRSEVKFMPSCRVPRAFTVRGGACRESWVLDVLRVMLCRQ
jgi:hypothetical protein